MAVILLIGGVIAGFTVVLGVMSFAILGRDDVPDPKVDFRDQNEFRDGCALIPGDEVTDLLGSPPTAPKEFPALGGGCIWKGTDGTVLEIQLHPRDPEALPEGEQRSVDGATVVDLGVRPVSVAGDPNAGGHCFWGRTARRHRPCGAVAQRRRCQAPDGRPGRRPGPASAAGRDRPSAGAHAHHPRLNPPVGRLSAGRSRPPRPA